MKKRPAEEGEGGNRRKQEEAIEVEGWTWVLVARELRGRGEKQNSMQQLYCTLGIKDITA